MFAAPGSFCPKSSFPTPNLVLRGAARSAAAIEVRRTGRCPSQRGTIDAAARHAGLLSVPCPKPSLQSLPPDLVARISARTIWRIHA